MTKKYRFGEFELDTAESRLTHEGAVVVVQPKVYDALLFMCERAGRLIPQEELLDGLWPDTYVGLEALTQLIRKVRKALDDKPRTPRYVETVVKRGYRFLPTVEVIQPAPASTGPGRRLAVPAWLNGAAPSPSAPPGESVARVDDLGHLRELLLGGAQLVLGGRFVMGRMMGSARAGSVYQAFDLLGSSPVALKVLHRPDGRDVARFQREVRVLSELSHKGIVQYVAHGTTETGLCFLATEWLEGVALDDHVSAHGPMSVAEFRAAARRISEAVAYAHDHAAIHRDLRPKNILLVGDDPEQAKVLGFGLAKFTQDARVTDTGAVLGTLGYTAPEQIEGRPDIDARADVFALGCLFFHMLTGRAPFEGSHGAILRKLMLEDAPALSSVRSDASSGADALLAGMLRRDRSARLPDGRAVVEGLAAL